jgi:preprotein translocase subunit SecE
VLINFRRFQKWFDLLVLSLEYNLNIMIKIATYFRDSYKELLEKVTWPTFAQLQQSTMIVIVATLIITAIISLMDFLAGGALKFIYQQI